MQMHCVNVLRIVNTDSKDLNNAATEKPSELTCLSHESSPCLYYNVINCTFIDDVHCVDGKKKISGHDLRHGIGPSR